MKNIFKKIETEDQLIIRWADSLILNSDHKGVVSKKSLLHDWYNSDNPSNEKEKLEWDKNTSKIIRDEALIMSGVFDANMGVQIHELSRLAEFVKEFLTKQGYINEPKFIEESLTLTPIGEKVKELRGHKNYIASKKRESAALRGDQNSKRLYMPMAIAGIGVLISASISLGTCYYNYTNDEHEKDTIDTIRIQQQNTQSVIQNLQSQVDSISNLLLSKSLDTSVNKPQIIESTKNQ